MNNEEKIEYWTKYAFEKMRKDVAIMPTTISIVLELIEFKNSGVSEE